MDAGDLRNRIMVSELIQDETGFSWVDFRATWAKMELTGKTNLFSRVGIGARDVKLTMRDQPLTLQQALRWHGKHLFITEITRPDRGWMEVKAALVHVARCEANVQEQSGGFFFPAIRTEKYLGSTQREPQTEISVEYVLVTPKSVELKQGSLVRVENEPPLVVVLAHTLDDFKNEYEVGRRYGR